MKKCFAGNNGKVLSGGAALLLLALTPNLGWTEEKPQLSYNGIVEVGIGYLNEETAAGDTSSSDVTLVTAELDITGEYKNITGFIAFLGEEEDNTSDVLIDAAYLTMTWGGVYATGGSLTLPFGSYATHFISDPYTLELGETADSTLGIGFVNDMVDVSAYVYRGEVGEAGEDPGIDNFVISAVVSPPMKGVDLTAGLSYISNIADSGLQDSILSNGLQSYVGGVSVFLSVGFAEKVTIEAEYVSATDSFEAGELDPASEMEPEALNIEVAFTMLPNTEIALRYASTDDFAVEDQYGIAATYSFNDYTSISAEYLAEEMANDDSSDILNAQVTFEF